MASSTPSAPIISSRGAADRTPGRNCFSTPSAQVRVPVGDLLLPPPPLMLTLYYLGKNYPAAKKLSRGGVKFIRWRNNYPGWAQVPKNSKKIRKLSHSAEKSLLQYFCTLSRTVLYLYTMNRTIPYLFTLNRTIPYLKILSRIIPYVNTLSRTMPYLNTLSRTIPYLNTLSRTTPYLNTLRKNPKLAQNQIPVGSQSESSMKNLVSQSESSITVPKHTLS